ncbi:MAG: hypothetical protein ABIG68_07965 [Acidobacteriota bacterium]
MPEDGDARIEIEMKRGEGPQGVVVLPRVYLLRIQTPELITVTREVKVTWDPRDGAGKPLNLGTITIR